MKNFLFIFSIIILLFPATNVVYGQTASVDLDRLKKEVVEFYRQGNYKQAADRTEKALRIVEEQSGPNHPGVAAILNSLATLYYIQGEYAKVEPLYTRSLAIREKSLGPDHPNLAIAMGNYSMILGKMDRDKEVVEWTAKAQAIRDRQAGKAPEE